MKGHGSCISVWRWGVVLLVAVIVIQVQAQNCAPSLNVHLGFSPNPAVEINGTIGSRTAITCVVDPTPPTTPVTAFVWQMNGVDIVNPDITLQQYIFPSLQVSDGGQYRCGILTSCGGGTMYSPYVDINTPPEITTLTGSATVMLGQVFQLSCAAIGWPIPTIQWLHPNGSVVGMEEMYTSPPVTGQRDGGEYTCEASNIRGVASGVLTIIVDAPPEITAVTGPTDLMEGQALELTCTAISFPVPAIQWFDPSGSLVGTEAVYTNPTVDMSDGGEYTCAASNFRGVVIQTLNVTVNELIDCGALPNPENGMVTITPGLVTLTSVEAVATYACGEGYNLVGDTMRTCQATGQWNGTAPTCILIDCGALPNPANGMVTITPGLVTLTSVEAVATYACSEGYNLVGDTMRTCQANGQWTGTVPTCILIDCGGLPNPANGFVTITPGLAAITGVGAVANYDCNEGYIRIGDAVRICQEIGQWTGTSPTCIAPASCMAEKTIVAEDEDIQVILNWPETVVGQMVTANCTCRNITIGSASRVCGGDIEDGGMWEMPDDEACRFTETVRAICQLANQEDLSTGETLEVLEVLTTEEEEIGVVGVVITTTILENLAPDVMQDQNITMAEEFLTVVDNLLDIDPMELQASQEAFNTSARLLETVEAVAATLPIPENETFTVIPLTSFAVTAQDVQVEDIGAQTFSALIGFDAGRSIEPMDLVFDAHPNATASITIPATVFMSIQLPSNMTPDISIRITNAVYLNDLLFLQRAGGSQRSRIGSVIISTSIRSNDSLENLDPPVNLTFVKNPEVQNGTNTTCNFWDPTADGNFGDWSTRGCVVINETEEDVVCECDHLTSFSILLDISGDDNSTSPIQKTLEALSYIGAIISICLLILTLATYLSSKKLRSSEPNQLLVNLCFGLLGIYVVYLFSFYATPVPELCVLAGALVQYFLLATFFIMAADAISIFNKLLFVFVKIRRYVAIATVICWFVPAVIVAATVAPDYNNYVGINFCRPYDVQFFAGLLAPILLIYLLNWIIFVILMGFLLHRYCKTKAVLTKKSQNKQLRQQLRNAIALSLLFGLGWGFGLPATDEIDNVAVRTSFQILFIVLTAFQGLYVFILQCLTGRNAAEAWKEWKRWYYRITCRPDRRKLLDHAAPASSKIAQPSTTETSASLKRGIELDKVKGKGKKDKATASQNTPSLPLPIPEDEEPQTDTPIDSPGSVPDTSLLLPTEQETQTK